MHNIYSNIIIRRSLELPKFHKNANLSPWKTFNHGMTAASLNLKLKKTLFRAIHELNNVRPFTEKKNTLVTRPVDEYLFQLA